MNTIVINDHLKLLGKHVHDQVTGYKGIVNARILYDNQHVKGAGQCNDVAPQWEDSTDL